MNIAVLGYGTVAKSVIEIIENRFNDVNIKYILVRESRKKTLKNMVSDFDSILNDDSVDVVLEMITNDEPAYSYLTEALKHRKHVISSNKVTVEKHLEEYHRLANENSVAFRYEASVAGGIYWIQSIYKALRIDNIDTIMGVMNGTSNYMLYHMEKDKVDFKEILNKCLELGYAEQDYSADVDGFDVLRKISISSSIAYKGIVDSKKAFTFGIRNVTLEIINEIKENGYKIKLIGYSKIKDNKYFMSVEPWAFPEDSIFANVNENLNCVHLNGDIIGDLDFIGQGAGGNPTANAMIQDLMEIQEKNSVKVDFSQSLQYSKEILQSEYIVFTKNISVFDGYVKEEVLDKENGLYTITLKMIDDLKKEELITEGLKMDPELFYVRVYK